MRLFVDFEIHTIWQQNLDGMRLTESERGDAALDVRAIPDAHDIQFPREPGGDAVDGIGRERARETVERRMLVTIAGDLDYAVILLYLDARRQRHRQLALGTFHLKLFADIHLHALRQRDRLVSNSRHKSPDLAENFSAHAFPVRRAAGHHPARRGEDVDSQPALHAWNVVAAHINAAAGARNPLDARNHRRIAR